MEKNENYTRRRRRVLDKRSYTIPDASLSVRTLIDRTARGLPVNAKLSKHVPLPADGGIMDDFTTGTEEITDVTDAVHYADKIRAEMKHVADEREKARKEAIEAPQTAPPTSSEAPQ